jgi:hypothetical protein
VSQCETGTQPQLEQIRLATLRVAVIRLLPSQQSPYPG